MKTVISASRRTDIPAHYMAWFMEGISKGRFEVVNPYNQKKRKVIVTPASVHTIVFWSKNFRPFISGEYGKKLEDMGFHLFFNFTINSKASILEPNIPDLNERLRQLEYLCRQFGGGAVNWRFDPICFYIGEDGKQRNNLRDFEHIAERASRLGVQRCITSFMDDYPKIRKRVALRKDIAFIDIAMNEKSSILTDMQNKLQALGMTLQTCCEKEVLDHLPEGVSITPSACVPNDLLMDLFGGKLSLKQDSGQRIKAGCGCMQSVDIGSYNLHPCYHNCLFCYANPK
jgi:hypothetical protein